MSLSSPRSRRRKDPDAPSLRGHTGRCAETQFKPGQSGNPNGRVAYTVAAAALPIITKLAAKGVRELDIARAIGMSMPVWSRCRDAQQEVADALAAGKQQMHDALCGKLYAKAMDGDTVALLFLLKTRYGYREGDQQGDTRAHVTIVLPDAMSPEQYMRTINVAPERITDG